MPNVLVIILDGKEDPPLAITFGYKPHTITELSGIEASGRLAFVPSAGGVATEVENVKIPEVDTL